MIGSVSGLIEEERKVLNEKLLKVQMKRVSNYSTNDLHMPSQVKGGLLSSRRIDSVVA